MISSSSQIHSSLHSNLSKLFSLTLTPAQLDAFARYRDSLLEWNAKFNLTAITDPDETAVKHFDDSLSVALAFDEAERTQPLTLIDVGSGAGFPGVPLAIAFPHWRVTLLEATAKKVSFLNHLISHLSPTSNVQRPTSNIQVVHSRAEDLGHHPKHRAQYDVAVARAVAQLPTLLEYLLPFVCVCGVAIAQKGKDVDEEINASANAMKTLGGKLRAVIPVQLPNLEARHLIVVEKISETPDKYPRRAGVPEKKPL